MEAEVEAKAEAEAAAGDSHDSAVCCDLRPLMNTGTSVEGASCMSMGQRRHTRAEPIAVH